MIPFFKVNCSMTVSNQEVLTFRKEYIFNWFAEYIRMSPIAGNSIVEDKLKMPPIFPLTEISNPALSQKSLILTWPGGERNQKHLKKYYLVRGYVGAKRNSFELFSFSLFTP